MIACIDVDYRERADGTTHAVVACVVLRSWLADAAAAEYVEHLEAVAEYEPGHFYKRELPCLLAILARVVESIHLVVIDGYVILDAAGSPGLGAHLYDALDHRVAVVGVAKNPFRGAPPAAEVLRGGSTRPLFVTAMGIELETAARDVERMHGPYRLPTMLKRVDRLCRDSS